MRKALPETKEKFIDAALKELYLNDPEVRKLLDISMKLEGMPRHASTHAAGVVITEDPTYTYAPLGINEGMAVIQFDMVTTERIGLVKMDFLGLITLTDIKKADINLLSFLKTRHRQKICVLC